MTSIQQNEQPTPSDIAELKRLIAASCDGRLQPAERDRLESMLMESSEARGIYRAYMQIDAGLAWKIRGSDSVSGLKNLSHNGARSSSDVNLPPALGEQRPERVFHIALVSAACLALVAASLLWIWSGRGRAAIDRVAIDPPRSQGDAQARSRGPGGEVVATIVELSDECRWFVENRQNRVDAVCAGDLVRLTRGELRLEFTSGAAVTIKSPAALEVISPMRTRAVLGTLTAHVDQRAKGFTVETPRTSVVDLGTDFGVDVSAHGSTDVVVFNGAVDLHADGIEGLSPRQRLHAGEGVRVSGEGTASRIVSIIDSQFAISGAAVPPQRRTPVISAVYDNIRRGESWHYYEVVHGGMREDAKAFVDRKDHEWNGVDAAGIPSYLLGGDYVKTFNDDKLLQQVEIQVTLDCPAILFVLLDKRSPVPNWLRDNFVNTGDIIGMDGGGYTRFDQRTTVGDGAGVSVDDKFWIWRRDVLSAGTVTLGAIHIGGNRHNMYGIVAIPLESREGADDFPDSSELVAGGAMLLPDDQVGEYLVDGEIERPADIDFFGIDWKGGCVDVDCQTSGRTTLDPVVSVFDADGILVGYGRTSRQRRDHAIAKMNLPPGNYYIAVTASDELGDVGMYQLNISPTTDVVPSRLVPSPSLALKAVPAANGVALSWSAQENAESYTVERSRDAVNYMVVSTTTSNLAFDPSVAAGATYIYRLRADTPSARPVSAPVLVRAPAAAVDDLQALGRSSGSILLEWRDVVGEQGYQIERSVDGKQFAPIATVPKNACSYLDSNAQPGNRSAYRVVTVNSGRSGAVSEPVWAISGVADLTATAVDANRVVLRWRMKYPPAHLLVERAVGDGEFVAIASLGGGVTEFVDERVTMAEEPRYRIVANENAEDLTEVQAGTIDRIRLPAGIGDELGAVRIKGKIKIETPGLYEFELTSDDGSRLFIDEFLVVDNDWAHSLQSVAGSVNLAAGVHDLEVQYFQAGGLSALDLTWSGPAVAKTQVPASACASLTYRYYQGVWSRLPFERACSVSDVVAVKSPGLSSDAGDSL